MKAYRIKPDRRLNLRDHDPRDTGDFKSEEQAEGRAEELKQRLEALQERLYAEGSRAVLVVLQGMDTSGKDGTVRLLMGSANPLGCIVTSFKAPTPVEKAHDFLWRVHTACPPHGHLGIFNRSHYEDVVVTRASQVGVDVGEADAAGEHQHLGVVEQLAELLGRPLGGLVLGGHPRLGGLLDQLLADRMDAGVELGDRAGSGGTAGGLLGELGPQLFERLHGVEA